MYNFLKVSIAAAILALCLGCSMGNPDDLDTPSWFPAPDKPNGPSTCKVGQKIEFKTEGTDPLGVHEYRWNFSDGTITKWDDKYLEIEHKFMQKGTFEVYVQEQCPLKLFTSGWSKGRSVTVTK